MKLALCLVMVDPNIGGVLIMGERGTGKSAAVRSLVNILPEIDVVPEDPFNSSPTDAKAMGPDCLARYRKGERLPAASRPTPLVELPLGATEDRICGTIDIEKALKEGVKALEPGLLARANRGVLYVDEVNLLDDGLVDVVLDSAAGGINTVEREGVSIVHPAKFIMIGSGNPGEGEMRPQMLDRFGVSVNVRTIRDVDQRTQLILNRMAFDADPEEFVSAASADEKALQKKIVEARERLPKVKLPRDIQIKIADLCSRLGVDGLRGDLVTNRVAKALVALEGRTEVRVEDVDRVVSMCLNHRLRKDPLDPIDNGTKVMAMWTKIKDPAFAEMEERRRKEEEEKKKAADAKAAAANKKAGAWSGLPPRK